MRQKIKNRQHKAEPKPETKSNRFNILQVSIGMECSRETVMRRMAAAGIEGCEFSLKQVVIAFAEDYFNASEMAPRDRLALAQAKRVEREDREALRETVRLAEVEKLLTELVTLPVRQWIIDQPQRLDTRCNPDHPEVARLALKQDGDDLLKILRDKLV